MSTTAVESGPDPATRTAVVFTTLVFLFAGIYWASVVLSRAGTLGFSMEQDGIARGSVQGDVIWLLFSNFGPALAGIIALALCRGRAGLADLWLSLTHWKIPVWLYVAGAYGVLVNAAAVITGYLVGTAQFDAGEFMPLKFLLLFVLMAIIDGPLGEEIGWRGVLLPQLLRKMSPVTAAVLVGVIWYAWHIPIFAAQEGKLVSAADHAQFLLSNVALSVIMTWFYIKSKGSTFLMIYLHEAGNFSIMVRHKVFPLSADSDAPALVYFALLSALMVVAAVALVRQKSRWSPA